MNDKKLILFFDGICNLCDSSVQFILKHDNKKKFSFCTLQSKVAKEKLQPFSIDIAKLDSLILYCDNKVFFRSTAVIKVALELKWYFKPMWLGFIIPKFIRDIVYNYIARNRYLWFGKKSQCMLPTDDLKSRFLS